MMDWEGLRKKVRDEQGFLDRNMRELHALRVSAADRYDDDKQIIDEVQGEIRNRLDTIDDLCRMMNEHAQGITTRQAQIVRVKEMNIESRNELSRVSRAILEEVQGLKLFGKKRLSKYDNSDDDPESNLLRERSALSNSLSIVDETIENARRAKSMIDAQTARFIGAASKLDSIVAVMPSVSSLTTRIRCKTFKDTLILAFVMSACIFFIIWAKVLSQLG